MLSLKGLYEWQLTNKNGQIVKKGSQWNVVTDKVVEAVVSGYEYSTGAIGVWPITMKILLSDSVKDPSVEYREYGLSHDTFNILAAGVAGNNLDEILQKKWSEYNFAPPALIRTITMIGISFELTSRPNFASFIELSTPITQDVDQYLYVKYTLFINYKSGGLNISANRYIDYYMNKNIIRGLPAIFCLADANTSPSDNRLTAAITPFCQPNTLNNVMRNPHALYKTNGNASAEGLGVRLSRYIEVALGVGTYAGTVGTICQSTSFNLSPHYTMYPNYIRMCAGYSPIDKFEIPEASRVFVHPSNRLSQIFSDPAYPANSNGNITISGIPSNKMPVVTRLYITKTGDASDITDEVVPLANIDYTNDRFTVAQIWATGDIVRLEPPPV
jgi:hypothetical protein